ncbi:hypothetical protein [Niveibacterium microcysteis]|uniref:RiboL-PSP-HEPN domain-containing protein n=1 Tax=Niveibacterium microcysteis TaxID=2811415 RepID=A0ABX7M9V1_9RHOO|nr:hypothetical protein [Niveibacterium microcysteis]QSI78510.1 hypothetical protein JY500_07830 [Niveibacterium microcysteis]
MKSRTSEVLSEVGKTNVPFRDLPEKLRFATTFEAISALTYQLSIRPKSDRVLYIQEQAQKTASTAAAAYELSPHALGFDQANLPDGVIKDILKCFLIENPWGEMAQLSSRLGLTALPLDETYRTAALRRHRAAHVAHADTPQTDLIQFAREALAIAISFDALITRALTKMQRHDAHYLTSTQRITAASIVIRSIHPKGNKWRESVEGRAAAVKIESAADALLALARPRAIAGNNLLAIYDSSLQLSGWECY